MEIFQKEMLDTAYVAVYGEGSPIIGIASEYDVLKNLNKLKKEQ